MTSHYLVRKVNSKNGGTDFSGKKIKKTLMYDQCSYKEWLVLLQKPLLENIEDILLKHEYFRGGRKFLVELVFLVLFVFMLEKKYVCTVLIESRFCHNFIIRLLHNY